MMMLFVLVVSLINPKFIEADNLLNIFKQISVMGVLSIGMTFVLISGGIDLSVGYGVTMGAVFVGVVFLETGNAYLSMAAGFAGCLALGFVNGFLISILRIIPFVTTLATMSIAQGIINVVGVGKLMQLKDPVFSFIGKTSFGGFAVSGMILVVLLAIGFVTLNYTKLGSYTYALGSNEGNAKLAGINTRIYKLVIYMISGACMGISAIILGSRITLVTLSSGGSNLLMDTLAAVIIGGTSTAGGSGKMTGTIIGVVLLGMISNALTLLNVPAVAQDLFEGLVIIAALLLNTFSGRFKNIVSLLQKKGR